jgi:hyperosmotically inducible protein
MSLGVKAKMKKEIREMCNRKLRALVMVVTMTMFASPTMFAAPVVRNAFSPPQASSHIIREVRHELVTLPYYGVFDWLQYQVQPDNTVVLKGQVVRPSTKSDAAARVKDIDGVKSVVNEIEVLPLSPNDNRLRAALYRTIYGMSSPLFRYATQTVPPIHIIVANGRATLKGVVSTKGDAQLAYIRARGVPGLFEVKNELEIESEMPQ